MDAIILAGGFGTRLQTISNGVPKSLMPVGDKVYLDILLDKLILSKIDNIYLSLHYKPELFFDYIYSNNNESKLIPIVEPKPLGTGGAINYVVECTNISAPFFVMNGDSMSNIKLNKMYEEFLGQNLTAMIGLSKVEDTERYGTILTKDGKVLSFKEKGNSGPGWINNGNYIFNKEAFDGFSGAFSLEKDLFPNLLTKQKLGAYKVANDNFIDIGIPEDYLKLCRIYKEKN